MNSEMQDKATTTAAHEWLDTYARGAVLGL